MTFTVLGPAACKGSTVSFMGKGGRIVTKTDSQTLGGWTQAVKWAAKGAGVRVVAKPGAVTVDVLFQFVKPKSARNREFPTVKPDIDKMERALLDALTGIAYEDDAQVVGVASRKIYSNEASTQVTVRVA